MTATKGPEKHSPERDWRALRESTGLTLTEAARRAGINKGQLSDIENRERRMTPAWSRALLRVYDDESEVA
jgi:transcriptional regulator with XRE-family HTH domain